MYHPDQSYDISMAKAEEVKIKQFNQENISDEKKIKARYMRKKILTCKTKNNGALIPSQTNNNSFQQYQCSSESILEA